MDGFTWQAIEDLVVEYILDMREQDPGIGLAKIWEMYCNKERFAYLSLLMDSYTKEIVGYCLCETLSAEGPLEALRQALGRITLEQAGMLTHHSDRGCQYASFAYTNLLKEYGITVSMTESGNPKDNAQAERLNSTVKNEPPPRQKIQHIVNL